MADTVSPARAAPARRRRGEYAKTAETRVAILDAALEVFAQSGYHAGSLREIASRVGMSEAGLLHHFSRKSVLLQAVLDRRDDQSREIFDFEAADGVTVLRGMVELGRHNASMPGVVELYCVLSGEATAPDHPAHAYFVRRYDLVRDTLANAFERIREAGRLRPGVDPRSAAVASIALMDGLQVQWLLDRESTDMAEELARFYRRLVSGFDLDGLALALDRVGAADAQDDPPPPAAD